jgi:hypothetical protein
LDLQLRELLGGVLDEIAEHALIIVSDQNNLPKIRDLCKGLKTVVDDGVTGDLEQGL